MALNSLQFQALMFLTFLTGCQSTVTDTGIACIVPEGAACQDHLQGHMIGDDEYDDFFAGLESCPAEGVIQSDTPILIRAYLGSDPGVASDLECTAEVSGEFELTINSSFRWREERNESGFHGLWVECETPPLAVGDWTFRYGESGIAQVPVPSQQAAISCLDSGAEP